MKRFFYLSLVSFFLCQYCYVSAQSQKLWNEEIIDEKLNEVRDNSVAHSNQESLLIQIYEASGRLKYNDGVLRSGEYLMYFYLGQGRHKKTIEIGTQLKKIIKNKNHTYEVSSIFRRNGLALGYLGLNDASLKDFKTAVIYANKIEDRDNKFFQLSLCYQNIGLYYLNQRLKNEMWRDSIVYYYNKSIETVKLINDNSETIPQEWKYEQIAFNNMRLGINYLEQVNVEGNLELAEKYLLRGLEIYENKKYGMLPGNKITMLNQVSWLYMEKKDYHKSIDFANRALALEKQFKNPYDRVESFEFLATSYLEMNEKTKSKFFMNKYTTLQDSLTYVDKNNANATIKKIVSVVDKTHTENTQKLLFIIITIALIIVITILFLWRRKNRITHKKYETLISKLKTKKNNQNVTDNPKGIFENFELSAVNITDETAKNLLQKLIKFEKSHKYLRKDISRTWLANHFNTNTKYLTEIIKIRSNTTFSNYIHRLRIDYITRKLVEDSIYREYKIEYLAEECGYASRQVFITAFKKETGFTPSYFIENLKNEKFKK